MSRPDTLVMIAHDGMGQADVALQRKVLGMWLTLTEQNGTLPGAIAFYTDGVRLACEGSPLLEQLAAIQAKGVHLIICRTCLESFGLLDKVRVGIVGGMGDIVAAQAKAARVITL